MYNKIFALSSGSGLQENNRTKHLQYFVCESKRKIVLFRKIKKQINKFESLAMLMNSDNMIFKLFLR